MGSVSVQEFMAQNHQKKGRTSKLAPFSKDILLLKNNGYSQNQILVWTISGTFGFLNFLII